MQLSVRKVTDFSALEIMTKWMYEWWGQQEGYPYEAVYGYMKHSFQTNRLPQTYGMYLGDILIGMYQFTNGDLFVRPDIYPWLANVYIDMPYRKEGYGRYLLSTVRENAIENLHVKELYLFTTHKGLYEKFGWKFAEEIDTFLKHRIQRLYRLDLD